MEGEQPYCAPVAHTQGRRKEQGHILQMFQSIVDQLSQQLAAVRGWARAVALDLDWLSLSLSVRRDSMMRLWHCYFPAI